MEELFEDDDTIIYSQTPAPDFTTNVLKPTRISFPYSQEAKKLTLSGSSLDLESTWDDYIVFLDHRVDLHFADYFSKRHLREKISAFTLQINQNDKSDIEKRKKDANPYSYLKHVPQGFKYPGVPRMANIIKLFPELIDRNFSIPVYQFLTLGDKGGFSEYIIDQYQKLSLEEISGWALFPRSNFKIDELKIVTEGEINFETIQNFSEGLLAETGEPSLMLILNDLSWKEKDSNLEEKYMKLYLAYSIYLSVKLLARGGNLIVKLYNTCHPATIEMIYFVASLFNSVSLIKPLSFPPHSSVFYN